MVERQTAVKVNIGLLQAGEYVQKEGWEPNFVRTSLGDVSRVNVMAVVTQEPEPGVYVIDDGSGSIQLRTFDEKMSVEVGDPVLVIGRPRVYGGELFLNYEILKKIDPQWLEFRKKELGDIVIEEKSMTPEPEVIVRQPAENLFSKVVEVIRELDEGQGAPTEKILEKVGSEHERILNNLLEEGEVFEIKPGMIKILE